MVDFFPLDQCAFEDGEYFLYSCTEVNNFFAGQQKTPPNGTSKRSCQVSGENVD